VDNLAVSTIPQAWSVLSGLGWTRSGLYQGQRIRFTIQTTAANETFTLPMGTASCILDVDWGDGSTMDTCVIGTDARKVHTYATAGTYTVGVYSPSVAGNMTNLGFNNGGDKLKVKSIIDLTGLVQTGTGLFYGCSNATGSFPALPSTWTAGGNSTFANCSGLTGLIDPSTMYNQTDPQMMFLGCTGITGVVNNDWSACKWQNSNNMFSGCTNMVLSFPKLPPTLTNGAGFFYNCQKLVGTPDLSPCVNATSLANFCQACPGVTGTPIMSTSTVLTTVANAFINCTGLTGINCVIPNQVTNISGLFSGCSNAVGNYPNIPTSCTNAYSTFDGCSKVTGACPAMPNTLTTVGYMFNNNSKMSKMPAALPNAIVDGTQMFGGCLVATGAIPPLPATLQIATTMFVNCRAMTGTPALPASLTNGSQMFQNCWAITGTPSIVNCSNLTNAYSMFNACSAMTGTPVLPTTNTVLTTMGSMFYGCAGITGAPSMNHLTAVTDCSNMYYGCTSLPAPAPNFPPNITTMFGIYQICGTTLTGTLPAIPASCVTIAQFITSTGITVLTQPNNTTCNNWVMNNANLTAATLDAFLIWLDTNGPTTGTLNYVAQSSNGHLDANRSPAALTAKNNLIAKGWVRTGTY
jgi:hypothetical protein